MTSDDVLRSLACYLAVGVYNAETVDPVAFEAKIRDGIAAAEKAAYQRGYFGVAYLAGRPEMTPDNLPEVLMQVLGEHGPLPFRQIEAHVVLRNFDVSGFDIKAALRQLVERGQLVQTEDFRYAVACTSLIF